MGFADFFKCEVPEAARLSGKRRVVDQWLAQGTYIFMIVFVAAAPHSIAVTQIAYSAGALLWLVRWWLGGVTPLPQRLTWPLLAFLLLSALSSACSFSPFESCHELKKVALLLVAVFWCQNTVSVRQVKRLGFVLVLSCLLNVAYTGWQYTLGIGAQLRNIDSAPAFSRAGLQEGDAISWVGRHYVSDRQGLMKALRDPNLAAPVSLTVVRGVPRKKIRLEIDPATLVEMRAEMGSNSLIVGRGHPQRAQGFYDHYVTYADVLVQVALLAFGLFVLCPVGNAGQKLLLGLAVLGMGCALWLTLTRMAMVSFLAGALLIVFLACRWRARAVTLGVVVIAVAASGLFLHKARGLGWLNLHDAEGQYRLLMLKDGVRLIRNYPYLGIGMGSLKTHWREWHIEAYEKFTLHSHFHSTPVQIAVERGLLTLGSWLWFLIAYGGVLRRLLRSVPKSDWRLRGVVLGLLSAACAFLLGSLTDYSWGDSEVVMIFWMLTGWALALDRLLSQSPDPATLAASER